MTSTKINQNSLKNVRITDNFWSQWINTISKKTIPYQWKALNDEIPEAPPSHSVENFRIAAGISDGEFHGMPFQDSDVAKWIEAASYSLFHHPDKSLEEKIDQLVDLIEKAQQDDGYINTYYTVAKPDERWTDFSHGHELYCAGHLIEAAVAYYEATGKDKLVKIVSRFVEYIDSMFGPEDFKRKVYPGHEEIELALFRLFKVTGNEKCVNLSSFFLRERGTQPSFLLEEKTLIGERDRWFGLDYHQAHAPITEQTTAHGHSVRAMYLYSGMADLALETGDKEIINVLKELWTDVTNKKMYITAGIGSQGHGERFTFPFDLPNDVAYAETCASIGLMFWAKRMLEIENNRDYADVLETALYNGVLSGISIEGTKYFYVNPLEVVPSAVEHRFDHKHVEPERVSWFGCACCPPNIARLITSLGQYIYTITDDKVNVHLYMGNETKFEVSGQMVHLIQKTNYPSCGEVVFEVTPDYPVNFDLSLRLPSWCQNYQVVVNEELVDLELGSDGYITITREWKKGDRVVLNLSIEVEKVRANPFVRENAGKIAIKRGPVVYCLEQIDNGPLLSNIFIPRDEKPTISEFSTNKVEIQFLGVRVDETKWSGKLYSSEEEALKEITVKAVPYWFWGNRQTKEEMLVWIKEI
ncbi:glycoside hydrolase family 127 protein [Litchfieldia alkalitelluris]|uniref:glycoside hydrolase family 127 protein n=1 Tax=Litchfieldia alkalitelluris TaxID=304268 RepID=UPI001F26A45C|nr:beta-L-arabinofuranosidase domain-containing protein [Litchfieldia alkalitelluris]